MNVPDALIVTRHPDDATRLKNILTRYQMNIQIVHSAEMALDAITERLPGLFIVDLVLPGMDGWELLASLQRKMGLNSSHRVIALTAFDTEGVQEAALAAGFAAYFTRPVDEARLVRVLDQIVPFA